MRTLTDSFSALHSLFKTMWKIIIFFLISKDLSSPNDMLQMKKKRTRVIVLHKTRIQLHKISNFSFKSKK